MVKIVSWNLNGIRSNVLSDGKLSKGGWKKELDSTTELAKLISTHNPDILCFQETKCNQECGASIVIPGYHQYWSASVKAGYSGVSVWCKTKPLAVLYDLPTFEVPDPNGRIIYIEFEKYRVLNTYCPNSGTNFDYRTKVWDKAIHDYLKQELTQKPVIWCGDLNVSPETVDVFWGDAKDKKYSSIAGFTSEEREGFRDILKLGYVDTLRELNPGVSGLFSWWNMRNPNARVGNLGMRLDYFVVPSHVMKDVEASVILDMYGGKDKETGRMATSDHAPIALIIKI